jgi:MFS family permease
MMIDKKIRTFRSFAHRNYRLYFMGQGLSLMGTWMQKTAVSWVVYTMTHSAFMLGVTMFATQFPSFLFSLLGGIVSDRYNRYKVLLATQILSMIQATFLTIVVWTTHYTVGEILFFSVVLGTINAFDIPARQPLVHEMVTDRDDLPNALALNSSMNNLARLVGPALSGIVLEKWGAGTCFALNAASFLAVIVSLLLMRLPIYVPADVRKKVTADLREGLAYVRRTPSIGLMLLMLTFVSLFVLPYNTLLPIFAKVVFKGNAATFGLINSFVGLGAIIGAVLLASLPKGTDLKFVLLINTILFGVSLILFSHINQFWLAMAFAVVIGLGTMSQSTICNTIVQVQSDKQMRGRVISILLMALGMLPIGSLLIGAASERIGARDALLAQGVTALIIAAAFGNFLSSDKRTKLNSIKTTLHGTEQPAHRPSRYGYAGRHRRHAS